MAKEHYWITPETGFTFENNFVVMDGLSSIQFRKGVAYPPNHEIYFKTIKAVKQLLKQVPNSRGLTYHYDRGGTLFEVTGITVKGSNQQKYNQHL